MAEQSWEQRELDRILQRVVDGEVYLDVVAEVKRAIPGSTAAIDEAGRLVVDLADGRRIVITPGGLH